MSYETLQEVFEELVKTAEENQLKVPVAAYRSQREKLRALRDEFGYQKTEPKKEPVDHE